MDELDCSQSLLTEWNVFLVSYRVLNHLTFVVSSKNFLDVCDLFLENLNEGICLGDSGVWVTSFEVIVGLIITVLLNDHIVFIFVSIELNGVRSALVFLLHFLNVEVDDLIKDRERRCLACLGAGIHWRKSVVNDLFDIFFLANEVVEFLDFAHVSNNGRAVEVVLLM